MVTVETFRNAAIGFTILHRFLSEAKACGQVLEKKVHSFYISRAIAFSGASDAHKASALLKLMGLHFLCALVCPQATAKAPGCAGRSAMS